MICSLPPALREYWGVQSAHAAPPPSTPLTDRLQPHGQTDNLDTAELCYADAKYSALSAPRSHLTMHAARPSPRKGESALPPVAQGPRPAPSPHLYRPQHPLTWSQPCSAARCCWGNISTLLNGPVHGVPDAPTRSVTQLAYVTLVLFSSQLLLSLASVSSLQSLTWLCCFYLKLAMLILCKINQS